VHQTFTLPLTTKHVWSVRLWLVPYSDANGVNHSCHELSACIEWKVSQITVTVQRCEVGAIVSFTWR